MELLNPMFSLSYRSKPKRNFFWDTLYISSRNVFKLESHWKQIDLLFFLICSLMGEYICILGSTSINLEGKKPQINPSQKVSNTIFFKDSAKIFCCFFSFFIKITNFSIMLIIEGLLGFVSANFLICKLHPAQSWQVGQGSGEVMYCLAYFT